MKNLHLIIYVILSTILKTVNKVMTILNPDGRGINPLNNELYTPEYKELAKFWSNLPGYKSIREVIRTIKQNQVILIQGKTGSGKSLLTPIALWDTIGYDKKILFSLPRQSITLKAAQFQRQISDVPDSDLIGYKFKGSPEGSMTKTVKLYMQLTVPFLTI